MVKGMQDRIFTEVDLVQNKCLGAFLIFKTVQSYEAHELNKAGCPLLLLFLVLPILYQKDITTILCSTQIASGIRKFSGKFSSIDEKKSDLILRIHDLAGSYKALTWQSVVLCMRSNMLAIIPESALVVSKMQNIPKKYECSSIKPMINGASRLGAWFAKNSLYEIALNLKVRF